jgi:hypothetical protein
MRRHAVLFAGLCACSFQANDGARPPGMDARATDASPIIDAPVDAAPPDAARAACFTDPGYAIVGSSGHAYHLEATATDYDTATDLCAAKGAHLVVIDGSDEDAAVRTLAGNANTWIGFDDLDREGTFAWVNGSTSTYLHWGATEPDDFEGDQDCTILSTTFGLAWDDDLCSNARPSVCECEPDYVAPAPRACRTQAGWTTIDGRRYRRGSDSVTWQAAQAECAADGAYLIAISDDHENNDLSALGITGDVWIGLSRVGSNDGSASGSAWAWADGAQTPYFHWVIGQPDNSPSHTCVLAISGQSWGNNDCTSPHSGVCECDPDPPN